MPSALSQLSPDVLAMMRRGVSVQVASGSAQLRPSVMRAMGCSIDVDAGTVTVFISRAQGAELLRDIEASGRVAVMFSQPSTHRTVQLKATEAAMRPAVPHDRALIDAYVLAVVDDIVSIGFPPPLVRAIFACRLEDLVAVTFTPAEAFEQTPGPKAGERLRGGSS